MASYYKTLPGALGHKLVCDYDANNTSSNNATSDSGILYMVEIDATAGAATTAEPGCYVKIINAGSATVGSTAPEMVLYAPIGKKTCYIISSGWAFGTGLSFWAVTSAAVNNQTGPTSDVKVKLITT